MPKNIFDTIRVNSKDQSRSYRWYQEQVKKLGRVTQNRLMNEVKETSRLSVGKMYLFAYNPKHKDILPYYDTFPLVLPFRKMSEGFLGVNQSKWKAADNFCKDRGWKFLVLTEKELGIQDAKKHF